MKTNHHTKIKLLPLLVLAALTIGAFGIGPFAFAQTDISPTPAETSPAPSPTISAAPGQMQGMPQMADMESMKRMADMCQQMMQKEKAAMPFIIGSSVIFGVLLLIALVLLIVLEIQWIKYWARILQAQKDHPKG